ncbi:MAG: serpin family protein [Synergistaceae bacterium]|nr:serpin family protein [Synergistaceae bacterium]
MRQLSVLLLSFLWLFSWPARPSFAEDGLTENLNAFAIDMYRSLVSGENSLFFSPCSIATGLALTCGGARGDTAEEMAKVLHVTPGVSLHASMKALQDHFNALADDAGALNVANRLWLDRRQTLLPEYAALAAEDYDGGIERLDFWENADGSRDTINRWVSEKTNGKINDLLSKEDVTPVTRLVLTNAIYFLSAWREPFQERLTKKEPFRMGRNKRKDVSMMRKTDRFSYGETPELQLVKIPYKIRGLVLLVLLPRLDENSDPLKKLENLEKKLTRAALKEWTAAMKGREVALRLPRFRDEGRYGLKDVLERLGMKLAFTRDADFSGMVEDPRKNGGDLCVSSVVHRAFIALDEKGTEAAAATAVVMRMKATATVDRVKPVEFVADHPFIYCVLDDRTGTILFMGRMTDPRDGK